METRPVSGWLQAHAGCDAQTRSDPNLTGIDNALTRPKSSTLEGYLAAGRRTSQAIPGQAIPGQAIPGQASVERQASVEKGCPYPAGALRRPLGAVGLSRAGAGRRTPPVPLERGLVHPIRLGPADREQPFAPCVFERLGGTCASVGRLRCTPSGELRRVRPSACTGNGEAPQRPVH
jgi:hypothetical protein